MAVITKKQAEEGGYSAVTFAFKAGEENMMNKVIADLDRGGIESATVKVAGGTEVWRK